jgi:hypothetical protein
MDKSIKQVRQQLETLVSFLATTNDAPSADLMVVLGSNCVDVPNHAAQLYKQGCAPKVLFSGGRGRLSEGIPEHLTEAEFFRNSAVRAGVPLDAILLETKSTNMLENIRFTIEPVSKHGLVMLVTQPMLQRRAWATAQKWWPSQLALSNCPPPWRPALQTARWDELLGLADLAVGEIERLPKYGAKGDLVPQIIPSPVFEAYGLVKALLPPKTHEPCCA